MARKVLVRLVDDLDGLPGDDVATVTFSLDGVSYQIDLNASNAGRMREGLAEFVAAARRTGGRAKRGSAGVRAVGPVNDGPATREWARENGHELAERGRIPSHIVEAFNAATGRGAAKVVELTAKPARAAKTAAASRSSAGATATASTRRARSAQPAGAKQTAKQAPKVAAKASAAKTADKGKSATAKTGARAAKTPRTTASTATAKGGQRTRKAPAAKSR
jgi:hypothetical protein